MEPLPAIAPVSLARQGIDRDHLARGGDGDLGQLWETGALAVFE
ncbi:NUDIX hydrolase, partial [Burkholderia multivorans]